MELMWVMLAAVFAGTAMAQPNTCCEIPFARATHRRSARAAGLTICTITSTKSVKTPGSMMIPTANGRLPTPKD
jgi:hypothetical protein